MNRPLELPLGHSRQVRSLLRRQQPLRSRPRRPPHRRGGHDPASADVAAMANAAALAGHNSWMLTSSALVLFMTAPGLAMFYGGLVRKKNVLGVVMQCVFLMALMTVVWALWGYSLAFGGGAGQPLDRERRVLVHGKRRSPMGSGHRHRP